VYGEQCSFVLKDAQVEQNKIRTLLRSLHAAPIELDGKHKAKYFFFSSHTLTKLEANLIHRQTYPTDPRRRP
jgi:hypothetical protein